jgi:peptidyl-prolyl cis-trans isomerase A (cyclophilin A)
MMPRWITACLAGGLALLCGCSGKKEAAEEQPGKIEVPDTYRVDFDTSKGIFTVEVHKAWAPEGAERFYVLVKRGFYDGARFFRAVPRFVVQFGINGDPAVQTKWRNSIIADDPVKESNLEGTMTFATSGPNTRTTQVFINLVDNARLDKTGFAPFGKVVEGMEVVRRFYSSYGDGPPRGSGPSQDLIETQGDAYLERAFPRLDYIKTARIAPAQAAAPAAR